MSVAASSAYKEIYYLPIDLIRAGANQPRKIFLEEGIMELSESIKQYGVIQPICVRLSKGYFYELIAGERRLRAAKMAGLTTIPAIVSDLSDKDSAVIAMIENLQRKDLNYIEEAEGYLNLMDSFNFTQDALSKRIGKSQPAIANKIRLLKLSPRVRKILQENCLTERHARALLKLASEEEQLMVLSDVIRKSLNVAKTEELVISIIKSVNNKEKPLRTSSKKRKVKIKIKDIRIFENTIKQSVEIMKKSGFTTQYELNEKGEGYEFHIYIKPESEVSG